MLRAFVLTYLIVSGLAVLGYVGMGAYIGLQHNPSAAYCDFEAPLKSRNFVNESGESCRIRGRWYFVHLVAVAELLVLLQWPGYTYFLVRYIRRRRKISSL